MIINIIGKKGNSKEDLKVNCFLFGGSIMRKKRSTSLQFAGIQDIKIYLLSHWEAMISLSKKLGRFLFGL
jgi:hypothetical protein